MSTCFNKAAVIHFSRLFNFVNWFYARGMLIEQRTAEYRMSNRRISKGGFALLRPLIKIDRIPYFDIRHLSAPEDLITSMRLRLAGGDADA